jgi:hypothetical protein
MNKKAGAGMWKRRDDGSPFGAPTSLGKGFAFSTFPHSRFGLRTTSNQKCEKYLTLPILLVSISKKALEMVLILGLGVARWLMSVRN